MAAEHLQRYGVRILERQFRTRLGEIDLIALDGDVLCFIEVRSKSSARFGTAAESVTAHKQRRIIRVAQQYLQARPALQRLACRFDVVGVDVSDGSAPPRLALIRDAFTVSG